MSEKNRSFRSFVFWILGCIIEYLSAYLVEKDFLYIFALIVFNCIELHERKGAREAKAYRLLDERAVICVNRPKGL